MSHYASTTIEQQIRKVEQLIADYSAYVNEGVDSAKNVPISQKMGLDCSVILTGSTGYLGCYVLDSLLRSSKVSSVYALNRKGVKPLRDRQAAALVDKGLLPSLLQDERVKLCEVDLSATNLGLPPQVYAEMKQRVQVIIHLSWPVVHRWPLERFEESILGTCNLIRLALSSYHGLSTRFLFGSSTGTIVGWEADEPIPEQVLHNTGFALAHSGYSESKYVIDRILERTPLNSTSLRLGQLCGSTHNGAWNPKEWFPLLLKSSITLGSTPHIAGSCLWVPSDVAGQCITDIALSAKEEKYPHVFNLTAPAPSKASHVFQALNEALLEFRLMEDPLTFIPVGVWLQDVSKYASTHDGNWNEVPAAKIINPIRSMLLTKDGVEVRTSFSNLKEYGRIGPLVTENGKIWSSTFKDMKELDLKSAQGWIKYWIDQGLFRNIANRARHTSKLYITKLVEPVYTP